MSDFPSFCELRVRKNIKSKQMKIPYLFVHHVAISATHSLHLQYKRRTLKQVSVEAEKNEWLN